MAVHHGGRGLGHMNRTWGGFSPLSMFAAGEQGAWYDPSDLTSMFQDTAGTVPVTAAGQTVARINDKSGRGNHRTQATGLSQPILQQDASGRYHLLYDGSNDFMTATIDMAAADSMALVFGIRKLSDAAAAIFIEASSGLTGSGAYAVNAPTGASATINARSRGTVTSDAIYTNAAVAAPVTLVASMDADISADRNILRINGAQVATSATDQGTGNYGSHTVYFGRRSGTSNPFNGREYGIIIRGGTSTAAQIAAMETWMNAKTGAF